LLKKCSASTLGVFRYSLEAISPWKGNMPRFRFAALLCIVLACFVSTGCSNGSPTKIVANEVPGTITLTPSPNISLEVGTTEVLTATAKNSSGSSTLTETFSYVSTNPSVVSVANNGNACAGTWDSVTTPVLCTPGSTGVAQVSATAGGISSPPVTIYVHQHITNIVVTKVPNQPQTLSTLCLSKRAPSGNPESTLYQASAFNGSTDITASVGPFTWQSVTATGQTTSAVSLATPPAGTAGCVLSPQGQCLNQETATANSPGVSSFFASASAANSQPVAFTTCPVQSISLSAVGNPATSLVVTSGSSTTLNATVTDTLGMAITGVPLTWSSSNPSAITPTGATSTVFGSVGTVSTPAVGAGAVTASCTPPTCNGGISPSLPIYPAQAISFLVTSTSTSSSTTTSPTVYVSSVDCNPPTNANNQACTTLMIPVTRSSSSSEFTAGTPINLPVAPNSLIFDPQGTNGYLGVNSLIFGTQGAMVFSGTSVSQVSALAGTALAISPDGTLSIFSDTTDSPNLVFICQTCSGSSRSIASFLFNGAVAAAFSPDNITGGFKAYVVSGQPCPGSLSPGCLLVYSKVDAAKLIPLSAPATDTAFIGSGMLGYIAGGDPLGSAFLPTCDDPAVAGSISGIALTAQRIRALPDGQSALTLNAPTVQTVTAQISGTPAVGVPGCPAPRGFLTVNNLIAPPVSLGVGAFTPTQFFLSPDGSTAYILGRTGSGASSGRLPFVIAYNLSAQTTTNLSLAGNAIPLSASLSPAGDLLFVGANDGAVHIIDTVTQLDTQQVTFPFPQSLCLGPGNPATAPPVTCNPDLVVAKP
jgi:hypothetical protein